MTMNSSGQNAIAFFPQRYRYAKNTAISLLLTALFTVMYLFPAKGQMLLHYAVVLGVIFFLYLTGFSALYALVRRPSLVLSPDCICYRISAFRNVLVPWSNVLRLSVETSSAGLNGKSLEAKFISVYLREKHSVVRQMPIPAKIFSWASVQMGYAPLSISAAMVDVPLEDVAEVMRKYAMAGKERAHEG